MKRYYRLDIYMRCLRPAPRECIKAMGNGGGTFDAVIDAAGVAYHALSLSVPVRKASQKDHGREEEAKRDVFYRSPRAELFILGRLLPSVPAQFGKNGQWRDSCRLLRH